MTGKRHDAQDTLDPPVGFTAHDHTHCEEDALAAVESICAERRLKLTPVRRKVLEILLQEHKAMGAYAILDQLREAGFGSQPPVAYRALDFLVEHGFVHRIERLNAFIACVHPNQRHSPAFLICRICESVAEAQPERAIDGLGTIAHAAGFQIEKTVVEAEGVCPSCAGVADA